MILISTISRPTVTHELVVVELVPMRTHALDASDRVATSTVHADPRHRYAFIRVWRASQYLE